MRFYQRMDLIKNAIFFYYLFFLVLSLFPSELRFYRWWFNYHAGYYTILCGIPLLVFALLQFSARAWGEKQGIEVEPLPKARRLRLSLLTVIPVLPLLFLAEKLFRPQLENLHYYMALFLTAF